MLTVSQQKQLASLFACGARLRAGKRKLKPLRWLYEQYQFGEIHGADLCFSEADLRKLCDALVTEGLPDPRFHSYQQSIADRDQLALQHQDEKSGAKAVAANIVKLQSTCGEIRLNGHVSKLLPIAGNGVDLLADEIQSIEHSHLVLVENLLVMRLLGKAKLPDALCEALFVYRGDYQPEQATTTAHQFFRRFIGELPLVCWADFDPAGLQIASNSGAEQCLFPATDCWPEILQRDWKKLTGYEQAWFDQENQRTALQKRIDAQQLSPSLEHALLAQAESQQTRTQEHLIAHHIPWQIHSLN